MDSSSNATWEIISNHEIAEVRRKFSNGQNALFACRAFASGERIADFSAGTIASEPTYLTVQVADGKHITLQPEFLQYINHSCDPNVFFNTSTMELVALRPLAEGEELTFFYPSTEWEMTQSFHCYCGSPRCIGEIKGAAYLTKSQWKKYELTDFIQSKLGKKTTARKKVA